LSSLTGDLICDFIFFVAFFAISLAIRKGTPDRLTVCASLFVSNFSTLPLDLLTTISFFKVALRLCGVRLIDFNVFGRRAFVTFLLVVVLFVLPLTFRLTIILFFLLLLLIPFFFLILDDVFFAFDFDFNKFNQKTYKIKAIRIFTKGYQYER
jgi:hypothetical protein